jgi:hypothetical protein
MVELKENFNYFKGPIVSSPYDAVPPDTLIHVVHGVFAPNDPPGVYPVHNMAHYDGAVLSVLLVGEEFGTVVGSAVMIAPGIALTAAHIFDPANSELSAGKLSATCLGYTPSGQRAWRVVRVMKIDNTDCPPDRGMPPSADPTVDPSARSTT